MEDKKRRGGCQGNSFVSRKLVKVGKTRKLKTWKQLAGDAQIFV